MRKFLKLVSEGSNDELVLGVHYGSITKDSIMELLKTCIGNNCHDWIVDTTSKPRVVKRSLCSGFVTYTYYKLLII